MYCWPHNFLQHLSGLLTPFWVDVKTESLWKQRNLKSIYELLLQFEISFRTNLRARMRASCQGWLVVSLASICERGLNSSIQITSRTVCVLFRSCTSQLSPIRSQKLRGWKEHAVQTRAYRPAFWACSSAAQHLKWKYRSPVVVCHETTCTKASMKIYVVRPEVGMLLCSGGCNGIRWLEHLSRCCLTRWLNQCRFITNIPARDLSEGKVACDHGRDSRAHAHNGMSSWVEISFGKT